MSLQLALQVSAMSMPQVHNPVPPIHLPGMDFAALQNADGQAIDAPPVWGAGATNQIIYIDGDVSIDLKDCAAYQNKTIVATGNITVTRSPGSHQDYELNANLIARGSIDIDLHGGGPNDKGIEIAV